MKMSRIDCFILVIHFVLHLGLIYERVMSMLYYNLIRVLTNPHFQTQKLRLYINLMLTYEKNMETEYYSQWDKRNSQPAYPDLIYMWAMIFILLIPFRTKTTKTP